MTVMRMEFDCCGAVYEVPVALDDDELLLHSTGLGDTMILLMEEEHAAEHPYCLLEPVENRGQV